MLSFLEGCFSVIWVFYCLVACGKNLILFGLKKHITVLFCVAFEENVLCQVTFMCYVCVRNSCRSSARGEGFDF